MEHSQKSVPVGGASSANQSHSLNQLGTQTDLFKAPLRVQYGPSWFFLTRKFEKESISSFWIGGGNKLNRPWLWKPFCHDAVDDGDDVDDDGDGDGDDDVDDDGDRSDTTFTRPGSATTTTTIPSPTTTTTTIPTPTMTSLTVNPYKILL